MLFKILKLFGLDVPAKAHRPGCRGIANDEATKTSRMAKLTKVIPGMIVPGSSLHGNRLSLSREVEANVKTEPILNLRDHSVGYAMASCGGTKMASRN
jgi:hypothetical protein